MNNNCICKVKLFIQIISIIFQNKSQKVTTSSDYKYWKYELTDYVSCVNLHLTVINSNNTCITVTLLS